MLEISIQNTYYRPPKNIIRCQRNGKPSAIAKSALSGIYQKMDCQLIHARICTSGIPQILAQSNNSERARNTYLETTQPWIIPENFQGRWHTKKNNPITNIKITINHRNTIILLQSNRYDNPGRTGHNCSSTNEWNNQNRKGNPQINWLLHHTSWCYPTIQNLWYDPQISQWCIIFIWVSIQEQNRRFFVHGRCNQQYQQMNGAIMVISTIMHNLMSSVAEAECGALLYNEK